MNRVNRRAACVGGPSVCTGVRAVGCWVENRPIRAGFLQGQSLIGSHSTSDVLLREAGGRWLTPLEIAIVLVLDALQVRLQLAVT